MNNKDNTQNMAMIDDSELDNISGGFLQNLSATLNIPICTMGPNTEMTPFSPNASNDECATLTLNTGNFAVLNKQP